VPDILLTTLNAKYAHASFGLRYLMANLGPLQPRTKILEFDTSQRSTDIVEALLAENPLIVGLGIYIWNVTLATQVVLELKRIRPELTLVLGGPEVSHETELQRICAAADYVIAGEGDLAFAELCQKLLIGNRPLMKLIQPDPPDFFALRLPYDLYDDRDIAERVIYVEASRGCPFSCEFCLSSLDVPVRNAPLDHFLQAMQRLLDRGVKHFKFVDRTFNLNFNISRGILEFFLVRLRAGLFLHFEMIPDRLPDSLRGLICQFPPGALQFEVGIQSLNPEVCARISRRQDVARLIDNLNFLRNHSGVHVHADLIVGLPGETVESFGAGFDRLVALGPAEIQVGMLKRLRGTPIVRHDEAFAMIYSPEPPYEVLQTGAIDFPAMQKMRRFARFWDLIANSGNFVETAPLIWLDASPFAQFLKFTDWLYVKTHRQHGISLRRLAELTFEFLAVELGQPAKTVAASLWRDYQRGGRSDRPAFLVAQLGADAMPIAPRRGSSTLGKRQIRRLA
jgi:radical SAM superfamily enzyme YgiQ (UPF0313 family)